MVSEDSRSTALKVALLTALVGAFSASPLLAEEAPLFSYRKPQATDHRTTPAENGLRPAALHTDLAVQQAAHVAPAPDSQRDPRRLAPRRRSAIVETKGQASLAAGEKATSGVFPQLESFASAGAGLGIVIGLFLLCMWLLRRSGPKPTSALPQEAVAVLGRVPLAARHFAHLIQVGRKLVLVSVTPDGVSPITEVSDPQEVDRLLGLCMRNGPQSSTVQFQQVLQQLSQEPTQGFLGGEGQGRVEKS